MGKLADSAGQTAVRAQHREQFPMSMCCEESHVDSFRMKFSTLRLLGTVVFGIEGQFAGFKLGDFAKDAWHDQFCASDVAPFPLHFATCGYGHNGLVISTPFAGSSSRY